MINIVKRLLIILLLLAFGLVVYFLISTSFFKKQFHPAEVVSAEAVFVFETRDPVQAWNTLVSQPIWSRFSYIPSLEGLEARLLALDSLSGRSGNLQRFFKGSEFALSLHQTGRDAFDFLFSIAFSGNDHKEFVESLIEKIDPHRVHTRSYSEVRIFEIESPAGGPGLSYAFVDNLLLATYSSFLIEDAIRHTVTGGLKSFKSAYPQLYNAYPEPEGLGVFRLSSAGLAGFIKGISGGTERESAESFSDNDLAANLELSFEQDKIVLAGASYFGSGETIELIWEEEGTKDPFDDYITNRTAICHRYDLSSLDQIQNIPSRTFEEKSTLQGDMEKNFQKEQFLERLTGEICMMVLEEYDPAETERILLMKSGEVESQLQMLKAFNLKLLGAAQEQVHHYLGREILFIAAEEFPAHLFDGNFPGFKNTYVLAYEDMIVMASSGRAARMFLEDMRNDNTWGKSIRHKQFLESLDNEIPLTYIINVQRFWNRILAASTPEWKVLFQKYAPQFKSIEWLTLQQDDQATLLELQYSLDTIKNVTDIVLAEKMSVQFQDRLIYGPEVLQNFNDKSSDYLVQDELHEIHLITGAGDLVFSRALGGKIVGDVYQIDFFKNGKLQLLFATDNAIFAFDRLGEPLPGYPIYLPAEEVITHLNLLDYDNSMDYRYFIGTQNGSLYLLDKNGNFLEGWDPRNISAPPSSKPAHHRLSARGDYMVAANTNGEVYIMNRKGEIQTGSPIKLGEGLSTGYAVVEGGAGSAPQIVTINEEGEVVKVNFSGELTYRNQLLRPDSNTSFHLIRDQSQNRHLFVLHEYNKISVLNADNTLLFEKRIFSEDLSYQFFSFGGDKSFFVVIDKVQDFIYLYNLQGELLNTRPINGNQYIEVKYSGSKNEYSILAIHENRLTEYVLPL